MKKVLWLTIYPVFFAVACGTSQNGGSGLQDTGAHYQSTHCEIFVDKVKTYNSSHGTHGITFYLKTLNGRLNGNIAEVGIRQQVTTQVPHQDVPETGPWHDEKAESYFGAADYHVVDVYLGSSYSLRRTEGVFYVRTDSGTTYWLKSSGGRNFEINNQLYSSIRQLYGPGYPSYSMIPTQAEDILRSFNPARCF